MTTTNVDISYNNICQIKRLQLLYNVPPPRYTPLSPYPKYTQQQLDMRRKAEILKYTANNQNSKSNGFTKSQRWSNAVNGSNRNTAAACIQNQDMTPTPTYFSDIPGPVQYLVRDTTIPLYNFNANTNAYGIGTNITAEKWQLIVDNDAYFTNGKRARLFRLFILANIDKPTYSFQYTTPVAFYVQGANGVVSNGAVADVSCGLTITAINTVVVYNGAAVNLQTNATCEITNVSYNSDPTSYSFFFYLGIMTISIPNLYTTQGFIYDVDVTFSIDTGSLGNHYSVNEVGVMANLTAVDLLASQGANTTDVSPNDYSVCEIVGE